VFPVKLNRTYRAVELAGNAIVTVLPVDGLNTRPADADNVVHVVPSALPSTENVWVRVAQVEAGGTVTVTDATDFTEPKSTRSHCGYAPAPSQYVFALLSFAFDATYVCCVLFAVIVAPVERFVEPPPLVLTVPESETETGLLPFTLSVPVVVPEAVGV
jgi:hypothetical protein